MLVSISPIGFAMNIGIFTDTFTPEINGVVTSIQSFIAIFEKQGHEVFLFAPNAGFTTEQAPERHTRRYPSVLVWGKQIRLSVPMIRTSVVEPLKLDVIHVQSPGPIGMAAVRIGKKLNIPLVYTYHTRVEKYAHFYLHWPEWTENSTYRLLAKTFYNRFDVIVTPSLGIKNELAKYIKKPMVVVPTGVNAWECQQLAASCSRTKILQRYDLETTDQLLITASRLGKEKNITFIIDSLCEALLTNPRVKLLIAGDGPDKDDLVEYVKQKKCGSNVIFLGFVSHAELFALYQASKAFVFASLTETQGLVVLEAFAMGLPVVAVKAVGVEDMVSGDVGGYLVEQEAYFFAKKASLLLQDQTVWNKKHEEALHRAEEYSIERMAGKILGLYQSLLK